jgi:hypothetical protein
MSYIGSTPTTQSFIAGTDYFNGTGSAVNFTLSRSVNSVNDIEVIVNNVEQIPSGYSVSGTTLTFSAAPSAGTSNVYVRYLSTTILSVVAGNVTPTAVSDQLNLSTGYFALPSGTTAQRPGSPVNGMLRYNTTTSQSEIYQNGGWVTFAVAAPSSVNYLAVAGGGGGGGPSGNGGVGGGGAGGLLTGSVSVNPSSVYTITVGAGGATQVNGVNTTALGLTAIGGGRGGIAAGSNGTSGGSGGGGGESGGAGGAGTSGQGNAGGSGAGAGDSGAGGGGASAVGSNAANNLAGNGGNGVANSLSGSSVTYAGGGGGSSYVGNPGTGGNGGSGGGGNGATPARSNVSTGGTANTGGGGGGFGTGQSGSGAGGSGIVIISFANTFRAATATGTFTLSNTGGNYIYTFTGSGTIAF